MPTCFISADGVSVDVLEADLKRHLGDDAAFSNGQNKVMLRTPFGSL